MLLYLDTCNILLTRMIIISFRLSTRQRCVTLPLAELTSTYLRLGEENWPTHFASKACLKLAGLTPFPWAPSAS